MEEVKKNIYEKLQLMRVELQKMDIKKSGQNKFVGYNYFEQSDFLPAVKELMLKYKTTSVITFNKDWAIFKLINTENPQEFIEFASPMAEANLKGAHAIQNLGAVETYQRRYLYLNVFDIVEDDILDKTQQEQPIKKEEKVQVLQKQVDGITNNNKVCPKCGAKMLFSKNKQTWYCSALCWKNPKQEEPKQEEEINVDNLNF